ncbi:hypothetical protein GUJ93_ZPchr0005g15412 [Zizania palustris]|uniref:Uncharacterized protein n=1 Tax=Zizania palustris TaxID=103762 RepID=A0A8J5W1W7_ZIZPA|nr:hypothetical protein GUJ93_ZPchr0005g15412 [Zizania palustris]
MGRRAEATGRRRSSRGTRRSHKPRAAALFGVKMDLWLLPAEQQQYHHFYFLQSLQILFVREATSNQRMHASVVDVYVLFAVVCALLRPSPSCASCPAAAHLRPDTAYAAARLRSAMASKVAPVRPGTPWNVNSCVAA